MSKIVGGSVGVVFIAGGALIAFGGLTGSLASILAALFAPDQLVAFSNTTSTDIPPAVTQPPSRSGPSGVPDTGTPLLQGGGGAPQIENPPGEGEIVPPEALPPGTSSVVPAPWTPPADIIPPDAITPFEIPALPFP